MSHPNATISFHPPLGETRKCSIFSKLPLSFQTVPLHVKERRGNGNRKKGTKQTRRRREKGREGIVAFPFFSFSSMEPNYHGKARKELGHEWIET